MTEKGGEIDAARSRKNRKRGHGYAVYGGNASRHRRKQAPRRNPTQQARCYCQTDQRETGNDYLPACKQKEEPGCGHTCQAQPRDNGGPAAQSLPFWRLWVELRGDFERATQLSRNFLLRVAVCQLEGKMLFIFLNNLPCIRQAAAFQLRLQGL